MKTSLISVTFRNKTVEEIADIARKGGLEAVEWGGDKHVKPGDKEAIALANKVCAENGLSISAYGSYYRCNNSEDFAPVLETALALGAKIIRVWAGGGFVHSRDCSPEYRAEITENLRKAVKLANEAGCIVATECHPNTLTDCLSSHQQLLADVPGLYTYWQPFYDLTREENLAYILALGNKVVNVHIFNRDDTNARTPLADGADRWNTYIPALRAHTQAQSLGLEFVLGDSDEQYFADCETFHNLMKG